MLVAIGLITLLVIASIAILFFRKHSNNHQYIESAPTNTEASAFGGNKTNKPESKKLNLKEKLELSWKFLYEITENIINKFSPEDVNEVHKIGTSLLESGMRYEHIIDLGIKLTPSEGKFADIEQEKSDEHNASGVSI